MESDNYQRMARAIAFMREHHLTQPDLATVAQQVGLSEFHFQRIFTQSVGLSPKRFSQCLTVEYAKSRIDHTRSLLDLTWDVGLSSPGRLHDLFVHFEAMSPGEFKALGAGLKIYYGIHDTPFGQALIATTDRGICALHFLDAQPAIASLQTEWANAELIDDCQVTQPLIDQIFSSRNQPLTVLVKGTNFQVQVWRALLRIPAGGLTTYQTIAHLIDRPRAVRAVGSAIGKNAIGYLIPCHRVIRESGALGGYRWGLDRKAAILAWEASQIDQVTGEGNANCGNC